MDQVFSYISRWFGHPNIQAGATTTTTPQNDQYTHIEAQSYYFTIPEGVMAQPDVITQVLPFVTDNEVNDRVEYKEEEEEEVVKKLIQVIVTEEVTHSQGFARPINDDYGVSQETVSLIVPDLKSECVEHEEEKQEVVVGEVIQVLAGEEVTHSREFAKPINNDYGVSQDTIPLNVIDSKKKKLLNRRRKKKNVVVEKAIQGVVQEEVAYSQRFVKPIKDDYGVSQETVPLTVAALKSESVEQEEEKEVFVEEGITVVLREVVTHIQEFAKPINKDYSVSQENDLKKKNLSKIWRKKKKVDVEKVIQGVVLESVIPRQGFARLINGDYGVSQETVPLIVGDLKRESVKQEGEKEVVIGEVIPFIAREKGTHSQGFYEPETIPSTMIDLKKKKLSNRKTMTNVAVKKVIQPVEQKKVTHSQGFSMPINHDYITSQETNPLIVTDLKSESVEHEEEKEVVVEEVIPVVVREEGTHSQLFAKSINNDYDNSQEIIPSTMIDLKNKKLSNKRKNKKVVVEKVIQDVVQEEMAHSQEFARPINDDYSVSQETVPLIVADLKSKSVGHEEEKEVLVKEVIPVVVREEGTHSQLFAKPINNDYDNSQEVIPSTMIDLKKKRLSNTRKKKKVLVEKVIQDVVHEEVTHSQEYARPINDDYGVSQETVPLIVGNLKTKSVEHEEEKVIVEKVIPVVVREKVTHSQGFSESINNDYDDSQETIPLTIIDLKRKKLLNRRKKKKVFIEKVMQVVVLEEVTHSQGFYMPINDDYSISQETVPLIVLKSDSVEHEEEKEIVVEKVIPLAVWEEGTHSQGFMKPINNDYDNSQEVIPSNMIDLRKEKLSNRRKKKNVAVEKVIQDVVHEEVTLSQGFARPIDDDYGVSQEAVSLIVADLKSQSVEQKEKEEVVVEEVIPVVVREEVTHSQGFVKAINNDYGVSQETVRLIGIDLKKKKLSNRWRIKKKVVVEKVIQDIVHEVVTHSQGFARPINNDYSVSQETVSLLLVDLKSESLEHEDKKQEVIVEEVIQEVVKKEVINNVLASSNKKNVSLKKKKKKNVVLGDTVGRIGPYTSIQKILLVGEGDFSFSTSLAKAFGSASNMIATSLNSPEFLRKHYSEFPNNKTELESRGCTVIHGVDATDMIHHPVLRNLRFDCIIYNFPHTGKFAKTDAHLLKNQNLVSGFVRNAKKMMKEDGEIHITHKTSCFYRKWDIPKIGSDQGLHLVTEIGFKRERYHGYHTKFGFGGDHDFECNPSKTYKFGLHPK